MAKDTSKPSQLSEEFVQESSDEGDAMSGVEESKEAAKEAAEEPEESDSANPGSDSDESQASSGTESDASSTSKKRSRPTTTTESTPAPAAKRPKNKSTFRIPAQPYKPPPGFEPLKASSKDQDLRPFANLEGKQIWHITAPASVDLTEVHELDIGAALRGESILTTNGLSYGMQPAAEQGEVLLLPSENPVVYKQKAKVARTFRLRQVSTAANAGKGHGATSESSAEAAKTDGMKFTAQAPGKKKEPRKQPERLGYKLAPLGVDKPVPKHDEGLRLANAILKRAAAQSSEPLGADAALAATSPEKRKKEKKKKKSKGEDTVAV